jgi:protein-disulfide isomerase
MARFAVLLVAALGLFGAGFGLSQVLRPEPEPGLDTADVRAIVEQVLAEQEPALATSDVQAIVEGMLAEQEPVAVAGSVLDPDELNPLIESFLMDDPSILQRMSTALETRLAAEERARSTLAITAMSDRIFDAEGHVMLGNPEGDVTLVELFDYNCVYCRQALPDLAELLAEDDNLRVILKEFPILSAGSLDAARVGVLVAESDVDYWQFHEALFTSPGQVDREVALRAAEALGLSRVSIELDMETERVARVIQNSYEIAQALNITGTPTYIIGDEIIPGAIGVEELRERIANMRECGETQCG